MRKVYFTSDTHFGHSNIIKYCDRPFKDVSHMNEVLIQNWNERVMTWDTVYHLGDFSMGPKILRPEYLKRLNGHKILIRGNHDAPAKVMLEAGFEEVHEEAEFNGWKLIHVPLGMKGKVLCGHVHTSWRRHTDNEKDIINVGVDVWDFKPRDFEELMGATSNDR